uniref:Uncharacterized protein n=1 Tax=Escherichia coli TaxID=562 RepID=A0A6M9X1T8_ECOLX|nr:hypothetical protein [Escherichia coli]QKN61151.1 hypothetical protein HHJ25_23430 [Escherichia coli]
MIKKELLLRIFIINNYHLQFAHMPMLFFLDILTLTWKKYYWRHYDRTTQREGVITFCKITDRLFYSILPDNPKRWVSIWIDEITFKKKITTEEENLLSRDIGVYSSIKTQGSLKGLYYSIDIDGVYPQGDGNIYAIIPPHYSKYQRCQ